LSRATKEGWLGAYLYYAEPWEAFLVHGIKPFVQSILKEELATQFFFIRYWERGPHIRLRFKGDRNILEQEVKPWLTFFFLNYFQAKPSQRHEPDWVKALPAAQRWFANNSLQFITYEPEIQRYGGTTGILVAEKQFEISSQAVLACLEAGDEWTYERALGTAIQLHLGFAWALGMNLLETGYFYTSIFKNWFAQAYSSIPSSSPEEIQKRQKDILDAFDYNFEQQKNTLVGYHQMVWNVLVKGMEFEQAWLNRWLRGMDTVGRELKAAQQKNLLALPQSFKPESELDVPAKKQMLWPILGSYVHMTNNRLGVLNRDEAYLGYLIKRSLEHLHGDMTRG
jgi:thiopeptide-type bacteriocin biosynthesis protein